MWQARKRKKKRVHIWLDVGVHMCFVLCFFSTGRGGEQLAAASHPSADAPDPSDAPAATSRGNGGKKTKTTKKIIKQLELSPLVRSTFGASPPAGVEQEKEKEAGPG